MPAPDVNLQVGSGSHAQQTAHIMCRFEPVVLEKKPDFVVVYGDVNSTVAAALVCSKLMVRVAHVEAGLRSFDRGMPEEINRLLTDQIADLLYTSERAGNDNLAREGISAERVCFAGNVMIDSLVRHREKAVPPAETLARNGVRADGFDVAADFAVVTLHRPSNVDEPDSLAEALQLLREVSERIPLIWPLH